MPLPPFGLSAPDHIGALFVKIGGRYTIGAMRLCDSPPNSLLFQASGDGVSRRPSKWDADGQVVDFENGLDFPVGGPTGAAWRMVLSIEPSGTCSAWLTGAGGAGRQLLAVRENLGGDAVTAEIYSFWREARAQVGTK